MIINKKALSPLIAAVLLIVVVVGIGAVVAGIARNFVSENRDTVTQKQGEMSCSRDVALSVITINEDFQACIGSDYVYAILENEGSDIDDFRLQVFHDSGIFANDSISADDVFTSGESQEFNVTIGSLTGIVEIKFTPKLKKSGTSGYNYCSAITVKLSNLDAC